METESLKGMVVFKRLEEAVTRLNKSVSEFPVGAVSLDDFKPIEEKIQNMRENLRHLNAKILILKAQRESQLTSGAPSEENEEKTLKDLHEATANALINRRAIKLCLHSKAIQAILSGTEGDDESRKKIRVCMHKLFTLNDKIISLQEEIENATQKQLDLKIQCQSALFEYKHFLKEQEELHSKKLQETNPEIAKNKEKMNKTVQKINLMKKLISSFIAASGSMLMEEPLFVQMLEDHRELISIDTILKMSQNDTGDEM